MNAIDHINVKVMAAPGTKVPWPRLIPVFHRWIQQESVPEMLIDVADYAHVPAGPGVMLIGHEAFYSVDNRAEQPGLLYNRRTPSEGTFRDKLAAAYESACHAAAILEKEPELASALHFDPHHCEVFVNDRMLAPNTEETFAQLAPELRSFFESTWGQPVELRRSEDPRELFRVEVKPAE